MQPRIGVNERQILTLLGRKSFSSARRVSHLSRVLLGQVKPVLGFVVMVSRVLDAAAGYWGSASGLRMRSFIRATWACVARASCSNAVCEPSSRMTMAVNTAMSSPKLATSARIRSFWRTRKLRSGSTALGTSSCRGPNGPHPQDQRKYSEICVATPGSAARHHPFCRFDRGATAAKDVAPPASACSRRLTSAPPAAREWRDRVNDAFPAQNGYLAAEKCRRSLP